MNDISFVTELEQLINKHCLENGSNTPDFILASYMYNSLLNFQLANNRREEWFGRKLEVFKIDIEPAKPL